MVLILNEIFWFVVGCLLLFLFWIVSNSYRSRAWYYQFSTGCL